MKRRSYLKLIAIVVLGLRFTNALGKDTAAGRLRKSSKSDRKLLSTEGLPATAFRMAALRGWR
jgi:hypothetical protein